MDNAQMLQAIINIKSKTDKKTQELINTCVEMGEDCPFLPMVYEKLTTIIEEEEKLKLIKKKEAQDRRDSWDEKFKEFKSYDTSDTVQLAHASTLDYWGMERKELIEKREVNGKMKNFKVKVIVIDEDLAKGLSLHLHNLKDKHDEDFDKKLEACKKKKVGGKRMRKEASANDEKWVCNEDKRDELLQKYKKGKGYYVEEDEGIIYEKYDKRYLAGATDPRDKSKKLEKDLVKYRLTTCVRSTPFYYPEDSGMCKGAVQWSEGKGKNTSKFTNRVNINNDPMVQCSQKATTDGWCDKCSKKKNPINFYTGQYKKDDLGTMIEYWKDVNIIEL